jgi:hypothetical protein
MMERMGKPYLTLMHSTLVCYGREPNLLASRIRMDMGPAHCRRRPIAKRYS